jgi:ElaA protein
MEKLIWDNKFFDDLKNTELYAIGNLRQEVFVVEQNCPYVDFDFKDLKCWHVMAWDTDGDLVGTTRLVPKGVKYSDDIAIGRVVTSAKVRRTGVGRELMIKSLEYCLQVFGKQNIRISAQDYLIKFYNSLGFYETGKKYLEDDFPHSEMYLEV